LEQGPVAINNKNLQIIDLFLLTLGVSPRTYESKKDDLKSTLNLYLDVVINLTDNPTIYLEVFRQALQYQLRNGRAAALCYLKYIDKYGLPNPRTGKGEKICPQVYKTNRSVKNYSDTYVILYLHKYGCFECRRKGKHPSKCKISHIAKAIYGYDFIEQDEITLKEILTKNKTPNIKFYNSEDTPRTIVSRDIIYKWSKHLPL